MKKTIKILFFLVLVGLSFMGGMIWQRTTDNRIIKDIEEVAVQSCNIKVAAIKKTCK